MEQFEEMLNAFKDWLWGPPLLILLFGVGFYLTFVLKGLQFRYFFFGIQQLISRPKGRTEGDISQFEALMTSLAGAIGTGSIVGVATAVAIGGLGSLFWMWITALVCMATKYAESLLAVKFRQLDKRGEMIGGPMEYIEKGLGWKWMAYVFAALGVVAAIGTGNLVQVNSIVESVNIILKIDPWIIGSLVALLTGMVILGGVKSIGHVSAFLVPLMALFYFIGGLIVIIMHIQLIPSVFSQIFISAFEGQAAFGGFAGASAMMAIQMGVSRSIFSNEAGLGISSIAAAAAQTDHPGRQAMITMTGASVSTLIVCTITGLVIAISGALGQQDAGGKMLNGAALALTAFSSKIVWGDYIVAIGLFLFAFSTVIAWAYYGEKCFEYLFGEKAVIPFRILFTLAVIPGSILKMETVWAIADVANGLMVIPNLIALVLLSSIVSHETQGFLKMIKNESKHESHR